MLCYFPHPLFSLKVLYQNPRQCKEPMKKANKICIVTHCLCSDGSNTENLLQVAETGRLAAVQSCCKNTWSFFAKSTANNPTHLPPHPTPLQNTHPVLISSHHITQGSLAHVALEWGERAAGAAPTPSPTSPFSLPHTHAPCHVRRTEKGVH